MVFFCSFEGGQCATIELVFSGSPFMEQDDTCRRRFHFGLVHQHSYEGGNFRRWIWNHSPYSYRLLRTLNNITREMINDPLSLILALLQIKTGNNRKFDLERFIKNETMTPMPHMRCSRYIHRLVSLFEPPDICSLDCLLLLFSALSFLWWRGSTQWRPRRYRFMKSSKIKPTILRPS